MLANDAAMFYCDIVYMCGYQKAAEIAKEAIKTGESVRKLIIEKGLLAKEQMDEIMDPVQMTEPGISGKTVNKI